MSRFEFRLLSVGNGEHPFERKGWDQLRIIEVLELTEKNYRLHEDLWDVVGANGSPLLRTLLK